MVFCQAGLTIAIHVPNKVRLTPVSMMEPVGWNGKSALNIFNFYFLNTVQLDF